MLRRSFLASLPAACLAAPAASSKVHVGCQTNAWNIDPGNIESFFNVLSTIQRIGFEGFETGFRNLQPQFGDPQKARERIKESGLRFFGIHVFLKSYDPRTAVGPYDLLTSVADGGKALGAERLIVSGASTPEPEALTRKAKALNRIGEYSRARGLALAYHNHGPEFSNNYAQIEGLLRETDPALFHLVVDAGHVLRAGANPVDFFNRHSDRIVGFHLRDSKNGKEAPLGEGDYQWKPLAEAIRNKNWRGWLLSEEERVTGEKPGEAATRPAREAIRRIFGP
ncbi:MAG: sugar phosphate isomerase/epimerase family protein [Bryobacteraceae bacterium]